MFQKYSGVLQCAVAAVNALTDLDHEHRDEVLSAEKVFALHQMSIVSNKDSSALSRDI